MDRPEKPNAIPCGVKAQQLVSTSAFLSFSLSRLACNLSTSECRPDALSTSAAAASSRGRSVHSGLVEVHREHTVVETLVIMIEMPTVLIAYSHSLKSDGDKYTVSTAAERIVQRQACTWSRPGIEGLLAVLWLASCARSDCASPEA